MSELEPKIGEPLPGAESAIIDPKKLRDYALNADHAGDGRHKARVFASALGYSRDDWPTLRAQLLQGVRTAHVHRVAEDRAHPSCCVAIDVDGHDGRRARVQTRWHYSDSNPSVPSLTTLFVET